MASMINNASRGAAVGVPAALNSDCFRALTAGPELRDQTDASPVMFGHFADFETWVEVDSAIEGHFFERTAGTAFSKTVQENRPNIRCLFHHGRDVTGMQVLGSIDMLDEDSYFEVSLFENVPPLIMDGLRAGEYGTSYRFGIVKYDLVRHPKASDRNPQRLPELTILEARVREFGPTPLPVYGGTSASVRSLTDDYWRGRLNEESPFSVSMNGTDGLGREVDEFEYRRSVDLVGSAVWALHPPALATIIGIVGERANGHKPTPEEIRARIGERAEATEANTDAGVAVLPLHGMIVPRADLMSEISGAASVEAFTNDFRAALADPEVESILIDIDSPGGDVRMIPELATEIRAARGTKPIVAVANPMAGSGAYWIAAAADELVVTPSGDVGSIGVYTAHEDLTVAEEKAGIKTTIVSAGDYKVERNPFQALSDEAKAAMQGRVDSIYDSFLQAVADGRGVDKETVLNDFGKGRMLLAAQAVKAGMADKVGTYDETLARMKKAATKGSKNRSEPDAPGRATPEPEPHEATTHSTASRFWFAKDPTTKRSE